LPTTAVVRSCYEIGRDGFWLHRYLTSKRIDNRVVDSSSIEVNRRRRRAKSDGLDVRKLLGMLIRYHAGEAKVWSVLRAPTTSDQPRPWPGHRESASVNAAPGNRTKRCVGVRERILRVAAVPESQRSGCGRRPRAYALPERRGKSRAGDQQ